MERTPRPQDVSWFLDLDSRDQLDLDPPYQRKSVWTRRDKQYFLDTIFHNYPCPAIFLHKTMSDEGQTIYHVVDGKQRLKTILEFANNNLAIPSNFGDSRLDGKKWDQLDPDSKRLFWNYLITVEMLPTVEEALVYNVFERINRNARKLTRQELRHAKFEGWLITRAELEAEKQEWKDFGIVTTARAKRMSDVQFISEIIIMTIANAIVGFDQDVLDRYYANYDVPSESEPNFDEDDFNSKFESIKRYLTSANAENGCVAKYGKTLAHFYSMWSFILIEKPDDMMPEVFAQKYTDFMENVISSLSSEDDIESIEERPSVDPEIIRYAKNVRGANTDTTPRHERLKAITDALEDQQ